MGIVYGLYNVTNLLSGMLRGGSFTSPTIRCSAIPRVILLLFWVTFLPFLIPIIWEGDRLITAISPTVSDRDPRPDPKVPSPVSPLVPPNLILTIRKNRAKIKDFYND
ncbi:hypothetical protein PROH_17520 [Prochlorothrix hollandica PCC 9006 = CALU 1027]|uniref:Uncharacterized protein n=1 Tax=Prochlorothrix hollandica PCC 9006 = CALU 1027 TaxID=317619 RepID=A0A0M2PWA4_PROHO|nr:hypothetical protein PROH_17520 [Prochlorothrix hollandica PCC 9006 = CALU 1027]